jgi:hypothetical protein
MPEEAVGEIAGAPEANIESRKAPHEEDREIAFGGSRE